MGYSRSFSLQTWKQCIRSHKTTCYCKTAQSTSREKGMTKTVSKNCTFHYHRLYHRSLPPTTLPVLPILQVTFNSLSGHKLPGCRKTSRNWQISQSDNLSGCFKVFQASVSFTLDKLGIKYATGEIHCWMNLFHPSWDTIAHMWIDYWEKNVKQSTIIQSYLIIQN